MFLQNVLKTIGKKHLVLPVPGVGCGVLGMSLVRSSKSIGQYASDLLKGLEYRGYDSTGAAFQSEDQKITLLKDVGAPSTLVETLGITNQPGKIFCGQVRWATFGNVDQINSQPHIVQCKRHLYGAHNGNITNTSQMNLFLSSEGHQVVSDNDGEIVVHIVEHYFDIELNKHPIKLHDDKATRRQAMKQAIIKANLKLVGSYAAVIVDPKTEMTYAIKAGSSLYFGIGLVDGNEFALASSDLTALLRFTKNVVALNVGECIEYNALEFNIFAFDELKIKTASGVTVVQKGELIERAAVHSKLRAEDT